MLNQTAALRVGNKQIFIWPKNSYSRSGSLFVDLIFHDTGVIPRAGKTKKKVSRLNRKEQQITTMVTPQFITTTQSIIELVVSN